MQYITDLGEAYMARGQFDDAIAELRRRSETEHDNLFIHFDLIEIYWLKGMKKEAVEELEKIVRDDPAKTSAVRRAYTRGGSPAVAQWMMDDFRADAVRKKYLSPFEMARRYAFLGDKPNTLKFLEASYDQRYPWLIMVQSERMFDLVHSEPRYQALIKRMGLPPAW
jgi:tetratricopeptide (TPR) repeat protein